MWGASLKMRNFVVAVSIVALFAVPLSAQTTQTKLPQTVGEFVLALEAPDTHIAINTWMLGFIWGVDGGLYVVHPCYVGASTGINNLSMKRIFLKYMNDNKDRWEEPNAIHFLTAEALLSAFPCPPPNPGDSETRRKL